MFSVQQHFPYWHPRPGKLFLCVAFIFLAPKKHRKSYYCCDTKIESTTREKIGRNGEKVHKFSPKSWAEDASRENREREKLRKSRGKAARARASTDKDFHSLSRGGKTRKSLGYLRANMSEQKLCFVQKKSSSLKSQSETIKREAKWMDPFPCFAIAFPYSCCHFVFTALTFFRRRTCMAHHKTSQKRWSETSQVGKA